jgi:ribulose-phosphate 3-epimerase
VNPDVPLEKVTSCFPNIDMILMMTVCPGFGGQAFIPDILPKIEQVRKVIDQKKLSILVEADGGIKADYIDCVVRAGAEVIVSGSGIFRTPRLRSDDSSDAQSCRSALDACCFLVSVC